MRPKAPPKSRTVCRRVRLFADAEARQTLRRWFGCVRKTYNLALEALKTRKWKSGVILNKFWLRDRFVSAHNVPSRFKYLLDTPKHVREHAVFDLFNAYTTNFKKRKKQPDHVFDIKFRSKKDSQAIVIPKDAIKTLKDGSVVMFPRMFRGVLKAVKRFRGREQAVLSPTKRLTHDCRLVMDRVGRFYLCVPVDKATPTLRARRGDDQAPDALPRIGSCDPGVRTFLTVYGARDGVALKIGDGDGTRLFRLMLHLDRMIARTKRSRCRRMRRRLRRAQDRQRKRIADLVAEVHRKAVRTLLDEFDVIIIPPFETSRMSRRSGRILATRTVRQMTTWSHFAFRTRLVQTAAAEGKSVVVAGEEYTSKTCTSCGWMNDRLGGAKQFRCRVCNVTTDRDLAGARNILLKNVDLVAATAA